MIEGPNHRNDAEALAILSTLLLNDNGGILPHLQEQRPAVLWALQQAQHRHAWVVCGPVADAMEQLMKRHE